MSELTFYDKFLLSLQKFLGNLTFIFVGNLVVFYFLYIKKYQLPNRKETRKFFQDLIKKNEPIIICPNHLTMIDSALIQWAFGSNSFYLFHFSKFPWNIPAKENVTKSLLFRIIAYLTKCILIEREGSKEHKELVLKKLTYVLKKNEPVCIFIEGTRSTTGRLLEEDINYGAGQLYLDVPGSRIIVVYLRGQLQKYKSDFPEKNQSFFIRYKLIQPETKYKGLRAQREVSRQILEELKNFEDEYFSSHQ